jgi:hypothetical protein
MEPILEQTHNLPHETTSGGYFPTEFTLMKQNIDMPSNSFDMFIELGEKRNTVISCVAG